MKTSLVPIVAFAALLCSCGDKSPGAKPVENMGSAAAEAAVPLPGDTTGSHWSGPSSGKSERTLPDPVSSTPNQNSNP